MKRLQLGPHLKLPMEAVEDVVAILGRRGRGKTTTAAVIVEELHAAGARFCVADPTDVWWGLKSSRDGKSPGIPCVVMGGEHQDVPLSAESGEVIADFVADPASPSCVLELKSFTQGELVRFMTAFLARLYHKNTHPLHLVLDEADQFAPQRAMQSELAMLGSAQRVTKMGRAKGLHPMLITQRPATLSKNVLTQAGLLIAHAITGPQDRTAVDEWIKANAGEDEREVFLATLPTLPRGTAYFWSPDIPLFQRVEVRDRQTFDSSSAPKQGTARVQPKALAEVDLEALKTRIASTIERAKADDPRELRKRISDLERQLKAKSAAAPPAPKVRVVEKPILRDSDTRRLAAVARILGRKADGVEEAARVVRSVQQDLAAVLAKLNQAPPAAAHQDHHAPSRNGVDGPGGGRGAAAPPPSRPAPPVFRNPPSTEAGKLQQGAVGSGGLRRILIALAQRPNGLSAGQVGVRAALSSKSGTFDTYISRARKAAWIYGDRSRLLLTDAGLAALGDYDPLPTGRALLAHWLQELGASGAGRMLQALADAYPRALTRAELGAAANMTGTSGTFDTYVSRLRSLELAEGRPDIRASAELFE